MAPHVTEKTAQALQLRNQYTFRVRRDATRFDVRAAVELMFDVKVAGVQVVNEPGKKRRFGKRRPHAGLEEGLCAAGRGPEHRLRSRRQAKRLKVSTHGADQAQAHLARNALRSACRPAATCTRAARTSR